MNLKSITTLLLLNSLLLFAQTGYASWYGEKYQGKPTASGEPFNMYAYTAANRTLPLGTIVKVTNLKNNKSVKVLINDRGPIKKSRIIDLSYQAAKDIGLLQEGIIPVKMDIVSTATQKNSYSRSNNPYLTDKRYMREYLPSDISNNDNYTVRKRNRISDKISVQVAAFSSRKNADSFIAKQRDTGYNMRIIEVKQAGKRLYKVIIVCSSSKIASRIVKSKRYRGAYIFKE